MWAKYYKGDYIELVAYLEENSPYSCPIYGNLMSSGAAYKPFAMRSGIYYIYRELGVIMGVLGAFNDGNVMVHTKSTMADKKVFEILSELPFHSVWGLSGTLPPVESISQAIGTKFDSRILDVMVKDKKSTMANKKVLELVRVDRRFLINPYVAFIKKCLWECFGFKSSTLDIRKRMKERTEFEPYWFLSDGETYVAQMHVQAMTKAHAYMGGICTPREHRRKGLLFIKFP